MSQLVAQPQLSPPETPPSTRKDKIFEKVKGFLLQGTSPEKLAISVSAALLTGTFPVLGSTTILTATTALTFRLNLPVMQMVQYTVYPLQLTLYVPLLLLGASIFDPSQSKLTLWGVFGMIRHDVIGAVRQLFWANVGAILIWACVALPTVSCIYFVLLRVMRNLHSKYSRPA